MSNLFYVIFTSVCITLTVAQIWVPYDCRRLNSQCFEGVCISSEGKCDCDGSIPPPAEPYQGFDCSVRSASINQTACSSTCQNGGTCYINSAGSPVCYCPPELTGPTCLQRRVDVEICNGTHIGLYIKPHVASRFNGIISIVQQRPFNREEVLTDPACIAEQRSDLSYGLLLPIDSGPCSIARIETNVTNGIDYTYLVRVSYSRFMTSIFDETHRFTCRVTADGASGGLVVGNERLDSSGAQVTAIHIPAQLEILERNGSDILTTSIPSSIFYVGQTLFVRVSLKTGSRYSSLAVDECASHPTEDPVSDRRVVFLQDRCPKEDALFLVDSSVGTIRESDQSVLVAIYAIRYHPGSDVYLSCNVTLCTDSNIDECQPTDCSAHLGGTGSGNGKRKRRDVDTEVDNQWLFQKAIILSSREELDAFRGSETKYIYRTVTTPCMGQPLFIMVVSFSGVLLLLLIILSVVFCVRRQKKINSLKE